MCKIRLFGEIMAKKPFKKKLFIILLIVTLVLAIGVVFGAILAGCDPDDGDSHVHAYTNGVCDCGDIKYSEGLSYSKNSDGTYQLTGIGTCKDTFIRVPASYEGSPVAAVSLWRFLKTQLTSLYLKAL